MSLPVNHLHLHVLNVERSVAFYERHLQLTVTARFGALVFLGDGRGFDLALAPHAPAGAGSAPQHLPAWFHFGCHLATPDDVRQAHVRLEASGVPMHAPLREHEGGFITFSIRDPDGIGIEIYCDPALRA